MKSKLSVVPLFASLLTLAGALCASAANPPLSWLVRLPSLAVQQTNTANLTPDYGFPVHYMKSKLANVPEGYTVTNGNYAGWCMSYATPIYARYSAPATFYLSYDHLPVHLSYANWDRVNYILNHKQGISTDVQNALWHFIGGPVAPENSEFNPPSPAALALMADAEANGAGFQPEPGQIVAVILDMGPNLQLNIIEVTVPFPPPACPILDNLYSDVNGNGTREEHEPAIHDATLVLTDCQGNALGSMVTDTNGFYYFDLPTSTLPRQTRLWLQGHTNHVNPTSLAGAFGLDGYTICFNVAPECTLQAVEGSDILRPASVGHRVWEDTNGNGIQDDGEPGLEGVTVELLKGASVIASKPTGANGSFSFTELYPGSYALRCARPGGCFGTRLHQGSDAGLDNDADVDGSTASFTLASAQSDMTRDIGLIRRAVVGDRVWNDLNGNGIQDTNEIGLAGVLVELRDCAGNLVTSMNTSTNGGYRFANVHPGSYRLVFRAPTNFVGALAGLGGNTLDSDVDPITGATPCFALRSGETNLTIDAGFVPATHIGDRVWDDRNGNGVQDKGEPGRAGISVQLLNAKGALVTKTTTDASGMYLFTGLRPGAYKLRFLAPKGWIFTLQDIGDDTLDSDASRINGRTANFTVTSGQPNRSVDCGLRRPFAFVTFPQTTWGGTPKGTNIAARLTNHFATLYGTNGLRIGTTNGLIFTNVRAIQLFLPAGGRAASLVRSQVNPLRSEGGSLAGQVLALQLNVDFSNHGLLATGLADLRLAPGLPLAGSSIAQVLARGHAVLGGDATALPPGLTHAAFATLLDKINKNFETGSKDLALLVLP